jgi:hypothetical protein
MVFRTPIQKCRDVIIGHSSQALLFSYLNNIPIIVNKKPNDVSHIFCAPDLPLHLIGLQNNTTILKTSHGSVQFGVSKVKLRSDLLLSLSMSGLLLNSTTSWNIKIEDEKINYFTKAKKYSVSYESLRIFDADNITGVNIKKDEIFYEVYDNIHIRSSNKNDIEYIKSEDNFVIEIYIYPSNRNGTRKEDRDIICKSILTKEQLNSFDYSDTICRMKVAAKMKESGFTGSKAMINKKDPLKYYYRDLSLVSAERIVHEKCKLKCEEHDVNIVIDNSTLRQIINQRPSVASRASQINNMLRNEEVL